jgi:two-component system, chemotaxis family, chemotaxis protein CheY
MTLNGTILLVDDEAHIRKYVGLIVRQLGRIKLVEAANGEEALAAFQLEKPILVLLDVNMPHMDGIETLRRLKQLDPDCKVVMLTSLANRQTVEEALTLGAVNYVRKDTNKEELAKTLTEALQPPTESGSETSSS